MFTVHTSNRRKKENERRINTGSDTEREKNEIARLVMTSFEDWLRPLFWMDGWIRRFKVCLQLQKNKERNTQTTDETFVYLKVIFLVITWQEEVCFHLR
jgi:hypothetical protein